MRLSRKVIAVAMAAALTLTLAACGDKRPSTSSPSTTQNEAPTKATGQVRLTRVATLDQPVSLAVRKDDPALYVAEKVGRVRAVRNGRLDPAPVLDLSDQVSDGNEQGLLGLAFSPDGGHLYVNYTDRQGDTRVVELAMNENRVDLASRRQLLLIEQPFSNHNGGHLTFGPDGMLYVALGDGGSAGDPRDNGQRLDTLLGKLLRLDPRPEGDQPYGIPSDNPFVRQPDARPEIWAYGLRNPWRFSFDRQTGDLWIGDVGQDGWEEVNFAPAGSRGGENYGWNRREGAHRFRGSPPPDSVDPAYEYLQAGDTCAVTGGFVYRGARIPALSGVYVYGDFCDGRLLGLRQESGRVVDLGPLGPTVRGLSAFGEDAQGELYAMSLLDGGLYRLNPY